MNLKRIKEGQTMFLVIKKQGKPYEIEDRIVTKVGRKYVYVKKENSFLEETFKEPMCMKTEQYLEPKDWSSYRSYLFCTLEEAQVFIEKQEIIQFIRNNRIDWDEIPVELLREIKKNYEKCLSNKKEG